MEGQLSVRPSDVAGAKYRSALGEISSSTTTSALHLTAGQDISSTLKTFISTGLHEIAFTGILPVHIPPGLDEDKITESVKITRHIDFWRSRRQITEEVEFEVQYKTGVFVKWFIQDAFRPEFSNDHLVVGNCNDSLKPSPYHGFDLPESDLPAAGMAFMYSFLDAPPLPDLTSVASLQTIQCQLKSLLRRFEHYPSPHEYQAANLASLQEPEWPFSEYHKIISPTGVNLTILPEARETFLLHWEYRSMHMDSGITNDLWEIDNSGICDVFEKLNEGLNIAIYDAALHWVVKVLNEEPERLKALNAPNDRYERMAMWLSLLTQTDINTILAPIKTLTTKKLMPSSPNLLESNMRLFCVSLARLTDCLLLFHLCQDAESTKCPRYCSWTSENMRAIMKGFFISPVGEMEMKALDAAKASEG